VLPITQKSPNPPEAGKLYIRNLTDRILILKEIRINLCKNNRMTHGAICPIRSLVLESGRKHYW
jgi:hypothetical protein